MNSHLEPETIQQRREELRCIDCGRLTTKVEAEDRIICTGACGHCGGQLISANQCGRKTRVEGKTFLCVVDAGHDGPRRYDVTVGR